MSSDQNKQFEHKQKTSPTLCLYPFVHLNFKVDGFTAPCFRSHAISSIDDKGAGWNGKAWTDLRKQLVQGKRPKPCQSCWELEDAGLSSYRQASLSNNKPFNQWRDAFDGYDEETGVLKTGPKQIELRFSNQCNFQCRMCGPLYSSKWQSFLDSEPERAEEMFKLSGEGVKRRPQKKVNADENSYAEKLNNTLEEHLDSVEHVMIAGGEPLLQKPHYEMLEKLQPRAHKITLDYSTNLSALEFQGIDVVPLWKKFNFVVIKVSIDGDPHIYDYVRKNGRIQDIESNIRRLQSHFDESQMKLLATLTTSIYNIERVTEIAKYFTRLGVLFHSSQVQFPRILRSQTLPLKNKEQVKQRVSSFLTDLEPQLEDDFNAHKFWNLSDNRKRQLELIRTHLKSIIDYMDFKDQSNLFSNFLQYDALINSNSKLSIFDYYPHWRESHLGTEHAQP